MPALQTLIDLALAQHQPKAGARLTPRVVNAALAKMGLAGDVVMRRSPAGYYYFTPGCGVPSLYVYNLDGITLTAVMHHISIYLVRCGAAREV